MNIRNLGSVAMVLVALPAMAQQTGGLSGKVTAKDGKPLAGVQVEATSSVMPQPRRVVTGENGEYRMPFLPPGPYVLTFTKSGMMPAKRGTDVLLQQTNTINVTLTEAQVAGAEVAVVATTTLVDPTSSELKASLGSELIASLPVGQDYRDLIKLMPGIMYTQDTVRGPSAGGSGQDNVHQFDGVNVNLPMYGTLSSQPAGHDLDQITINKGGADATGFNRSAGYSINSISKSGTNFWTGELSFQILPNNLVAKRKTMSFTPAYYEQEKTYTIANVGGPILKDQLYFFLSVYRPTVKMENSSNNYGPTPNFDETRTELFGKLTWSPISSLLVHASMRDSNDTVEHSGYQGSGAGPTTGQGGKTTWRIPTLEATWNLTPNSFLNFKATNFIFKSADHPDYRSSVNPAFDVTPLDVNNLNTQGQFSVPRLQTPPPGGSLTQAQIDFNSFATPIIAKYGYAPEGGGIVGGYFQINNQNFFRRNYELAFDTVFGDTVTHNFHAGVQWFKEMEDLYRISNGWGSITVPFNTKIPSGLPNAGTLVYFMAAVNQQGISGVPIIHSEYVALNFEVNDKIKWRDFTFNVGFVVSNDKMYGSGLAEAPGGGYSAARGNKYLEHEVKFSDTLQPRVGVVWNYSKSDTVYANFARFVPAVSSLPRASSWDRNLAATVNVYFDQTGRQMAHQVDQSSTGKLYQDGMKPRHTDEFLVGTAKDFGRGLSGRLYGRYRKSVDFWEDTNNGARVMFTNYGTPYGPQDYYIPDLDKRLNQIFGPTAYANIAATKGVFVIAQLDNSFTKYYEVTCEAEWKRENAYFNASYSWSHYYGNFDQDNSTTTTANDSNIFVGSSNIADDFGRQLWNNKYGNLSGDRRHKLKLFGTYNLPWWSGRVGAYFIYQSGQPWQFSDYKVYPLDKQAQNSSSTSDTNRYSEPAGSRTTDAHYQLDFNYTHSFLKSKKYRLEAMADVYNVFNKRTGYNIQSNVNSNYAGLVQSFYNPRRLQLGVRFLF
ncbi:MAG: carboxypeptidase regulatory-like domain-containing protein [Acidobacteria bacterium]|nr:carboxypeptidase regulatory-like domain-containing protein [Acidobacteriota bacterium]